MKVSSPPGTGPRFGAAGLFLCNPYTLTPGALSDRDRGSGPE